MIQGPRRSQRVTWSGSALAALACAALACAATFVPRPAFACLPGELSFADGLPDEIPADGVVAAWLSGELALGVQDEDGNWLAGESSVSDHHLRSVDPTRIKPSMSTFAG